MANGSLYAPVIGAQRRGNLAWESAAEASIEATLPVLPGLTEATTTEQELAIYSAAVEGQRKAFVDIHGDAFGCERRETQRDSTIDVLTSKFHLNLVLSE